jgi:hypothetical protein
MIATHEIVLANDSGARARLPEMQETVIQRLKWYVGAQTARILVGRRTAVSRPSPFALRTSLSAFALYAR